MKDQHGKELTREFAPNKRPKPEDLYKVRVVKKEPEIDITTENGRIKVTKKGEE